MTSLVLTQYNHQQQRLETIDSYVSDQMLYSHYVRQLPILILKGDTANKYKTECMMRGLSLALYEVEPGQKVELWRNTFILHKSDEYPDFNNDHEVWICTPIG